MIKNDFAPDERRINEIALNADLVIVGGGMAGTCCAITAAREGLKVVLVQDRPVLGGNASSEVRLWILGATSSMGNNNRWSREGGVINELLVENMWRNPDGNAIIFDTILLERVINEPNITLLLNTAVYEVKKSSPDVIEQVIAFCAQDSTKYILKSPFFCDASGDGIVAFQAGAAFRIGAESKEEFNEGFAPDQEYGELLGHSIYFLTKDMGRPIVYTAPSYALRDVTNIVRYRSYDIEDHGCKLWWLEYGGRLDTVHQTEKIKWELWRVIYGIWDHVKNSGEYPEAENLTLEWVGTIPGKRESRRFEGDYMLSQSDVIEQRQHEDAVSYGGWALDLHPADGVFSDRPGCNQWHSKGIYQIPLRCLYSRNIKNLWLAGRIISASHVAFGSSRVMATSAYSAQVVGYATKFCLKHDLSPAELVKSPYLKKLQQKLLNSGHYIQNVQPDKNNSLLHQASITASSEFKLSNLPFNGKWHNLEYSSAQLLPVSIGDTLNIKLQLDARENTQLQVELRVSEKPGNYTPEVTLERKMFDLVKGISEIEVELTNVFETEQYAFVCLLKNELISVRTTDLLVSGTGPVMNRYNKAVATSGVQSPPPNIGIDTFEFWVPSRRPGGQNLAMQITPGLTPYKAVNIRNGLARPTTGTNVWVADITDKQPSLKLSWQKPVQVQKLVLFFDSDFDHPLESTLRVHPERVVPYTVRNYRVLDGNGTVLYEKRSNYQTVDTIVFEKPINLTELIIQPEHPLPNVPAAIFEVQVY